MSGLTLYCLSAMTSTFGRGHGSSQAEGNSWAEKSSLHLGEGPHLENWAAVAVVNAVQSVAGPLCQNYMGNLVKHRFP